MKAPSGDPCGLLGRGFHVAGSMRQAAWFGRETAPARRRCRQAGSPGAVYRICAIQLKSMPLDSGGSTFSLNEVAVTSLTQ